MANSIFRKETPEGPSTDPYEKIGPEIVHLQKGTSVRHGAHAPAKISAWLVLLAFGGLAWLYVMDPFLHAWYKGEAVHTYLYLHNYGSEALAKNLIATQIFSAEEADTLSHRNGSFQDYYASPSAAKQEAEAIIHYMTNVRLLHVGQYQQLDPVGRVRYLLFIRTGIPIPTQWSFLDPTVGD